MTARSWTERGARIPGETYFFRDHGQFHVIRAHLLPSLLERRADARQLRVWSAGCSSGEEAYSLAIVVHELLPRPEQWKVTLVGTDVDESALARARNAIYPAWSFRMVDTTVRDRYFTRRGAEWELSPGIRGMVTFVRHDLLRDPLPSPGTGLHNLDLVLCRNLFIYFPRAQVAQMVSRLAGILAPGGFLVTAHGEVDSTAGTALESVVFPESVVYLRPSPPARTPTTPGRAPDAPSRRSVGVRSTASRAAGDTRPGEARAAGDMLRRQARDAADVGRYDEAAHLCEAALTNEGPNAETYYLLAHLAEERGARTEARACLRKVLYLDPAFVPAYVELAALHAAEGNASRARFMREAAIACLDRMPPDAAIGVYDVTAAQLRAQVAAITT